MNNTTDTQNVKLVATLDERELEGMDESSGSPWNMQLRR